jgi:hypothetical protein
MKNVNIATVGFGSKENKRAVAKLHHFRALWILPKPKSWKLKYVTISHEEATL